MNANNISNLIEKTGIIPKKRKGQNFLIDERIAQRQISLADIKKTDRVLEIGPGFGTLTDILVEKSDYVTCIELDDTLADYIETKHRDRITLIRGDATKIEFPEFDKFVSNIPYSVSTPIIFKLLEHQFKKAVIMVQKELAERMIANVGTPNYSRLTVNIFYKARCQIIENVLASKFKPRPKVDSAIVEIIRRPAPFQVLNETTFFNITKTAFNHRRKKIRTSLRESGLISEEDNIPFADKRIENLSPEEIGQLSDIVFTSRNKL
ncbi:MAG: 16S rRNA (adenine(1518)-N(6)/adenine(1519)-N(6))-dimethyltransferase RsmA [archaeon]|nr:16S rRNA (adenine(1518)-N(6)/adenine(1519)-N(6))-dimethyltransferase RsmA [archaeon]